MKTVNQRSLLKHTSSRFVSILLLTCWLLLGNHPHNFSFQSPIFAQTPEEYRKQIQFYQRSLDRARERQDPELEMVALIKMGEIYYQLEEYSLAIEAYQPVMSTMLTKLLLSEQERARAFEVALGLARSYYFLRNCQAALSFADVSWQLTQRTPESLEQINSLMIKGSAAYCLGKFEIATESYQTGLDIATKLNNVSAKGKFIGNLGLVLIHQGDYAQGIKYLQQDIQIAQSSGDFLAVGQATGSLGDAYYFQEDWKQALHYYQQSLNIARKVNYERGIWIMLTNIGIVQMKLGSLSEAQTSLKEGVKVLESRRVRISDQPEGQISFLDRTQLLYSSLQEVLIAQNKIEEALEVSERGRSRILSESVARQLSPQQLAKVIISPINISQIKAIAQQQQSTLVTYSFIIENAPQGVKTKGLYMWVIQPNGKVDFRQTQIELPSGGDLTQFIMDTRSALGSRGPFLQDSTAENKLEPPKTYLQKLNQLLIEPIASVLPDNPTTPIIFIPQGELFLIPFAALQANDGSYLIDRHTIVTAPAIQILELTRQRKQQLGQKALNSLFDQELLIVGNPTMPTLPPDQDGEVEELIPLPGAEKEAQAIAKLFNTEALIGDAARKKVVVEQMRQARIIHLATHGIWNDTLVDFVGMASLIALAPDGNGRKDDGLLTGGEILDFKLNAELVVLSACDTGRGNITSDGVIGLSRSLISAGIPSVISSLWSIPDDETEILMTEFYRNLKEEKLNKAQALRNAMLMVKKDYPEPDKWAAFVLIGQAD